MPLVADVQSYNKVWSPAGKTTSVFFVISTQSCRMGLVFRVFLLSGLWVLDSVGTGSHSRAKEPQILSSKIAPCRNALESVLHIFKTENSEIEMYQQSPRRQVKNLISMRLEKAETDHVRTADFQLQPQKFREPNRRWKLDLIAENLIWGQCPGSSADAIWTFSTKIVPEYCSQHISPYLASILAVLKAMLCIKIHQNKRAPPRPGGGSPPKAPGPEDLGSRKARLDLSWFANSQDGSTLLAAKVSSCASA